MDPPVGWRWHPRVNFCSRYRTVFCGSCSVWWMCCRQVKLDQAYIFQLLGCLCCEAVEQWVYQNQHATHFLAASGVRSGHDGLPGPASNTPSNTRREIQYLHTFLRITEELVGNVLCDFRLSVHAFVVTWSAVRSQWDSIWNDWLHACIVSL